MCIGVYRSSRIIQPICLSVEVFNQLTLKVSVDMYVSITIFLTALGLLFVGFFFSCVFLPKRCSFSIHCKAGVVVLNSLSFCSSVKFLKSMLNLSGILAGDNILM